MRRSFLFLLSAALLATLVLPAVIGGADAESRTRGVKFFVVDWRLTWSEGEEGLLLQLKGRTRGGSGDLGDEFEMETRDTAPVLEILRTCAMGRLSGTATVGEDAGGKVVGGALTSLTCRAILK